MKAGQKRSTRREPRTVKKHYNRRIKIRIAASIFTAASNKILFLYWQLLNRPYNLEYRRRPHRRAINTRRRKSQSDSPAVHNPKSIAGLYTQRAKGFEATKARLCQFASFSSISINGKSISYCAVSVALALS